MTEIRSHRDLIAWQRAMDLVVFVYKATASWPKEELYGLTAQARRAAVSVPANISEGYGRDNLGSYIQFLRIAQGSLKEVETHFEIAHRVGIADSAVQNEALAQAQSVGKVLRGLINKLGGNTGS